MHKTVILIIMLFVAVTTCSCYQGGKSSTEDEAATASVEDAKSVLPVIHHAIRFYEQDFGKHPESVEELVEKEYLAIDSASSSQWDFIFNMTGNKVKRIMAISTDKMPGGTGYEVGYELETGDFSVYIVKP